MVVEEAFWSYGYSTRDTRATFLRAIAEIESMRRVFTRSKTLSVGKVGRRGDMTMSFQLGSHVWSAGILCDSKTFRHHSCRTDNHIEVERGDWRGQNNRFDLTCGL